MRKSRKVFYLYQLLTLHNQNLAFRPKKIRPIKTIPPARISAPLPKQLSLSSPRPEEACSLGSQDSSTIPSRISLNTITILLHHHPDHPPFDHHLGKIHLEPPLSTFLQIFPLKQFPILRFSFEAITPTMNSIIIFETPQSNKHQGLHQRTFSLFSFCKQ